MSRIFYDTAVIRIVFSPPNELFLFASSFTVDDSISAGKDE